MHHSPSPVSTGTGVPNPMQSIPGQSSGNPTLDEAKRVMAEAERKKLESLMAELRQAIDQSQALKPFKDQLLLDITPEGLRIQIVDSQNRAMFDLGSAELKGYTGQILHELAPYLNSVPNRVSLSGHTDITPYTAQAGYNNWDLSTERANAARRALESGGLAVDKIARIVGLSSSVLFDSTNPRNPINRRISIIVMTKQAEESALSTDAAPAISAQQLPTAVSPPATASPASASGVSTPLAVSVPSSVAVPGAVPGTAPTPAAAPTATSASTPAAGAPAQ
jgi:chemotaxis protein MotB